MTTATEAIPVRKDRRRFLRSVMVRGICPTLLVTLVGVAGYMRYNYRGFTTALINYSIYATVAENRNLYFCLSYWFEFVGKLRPNEDGFYRFDGIDEEKLGDFERGQLAYHRGNFPLAIKYLERDINLNGESESELFWLAMSYMRHA